MSLEATCVEPCATAPCALHAISVYGTTPSAYIVLLVGLLALHDIYYSLKSNFVMIHDQSNKEQEQLNSTLD